MTFASFLQIGCLWEPAGPFLVGTEALCWPDCGLRPTREGEQAGSPKWEGVGGGPWCCPSAQGCSEQGTQTEFTLTRLWGQGNYGSFEGWTVSVPCLPLKEGRSAGTL